MPLICLEGVYADVKDRTLLRNFSLAAAKTWVNSDRIVAAESAIAMSVDRLYLDDGGTLIAPVGFVNTSAGRSVFGSNIPKFKSAAEPHDNYWIRPSAILAISSYSDQYPLNAQITIAGGKIFSVQHRFAELEFMMKR